MSGFTASAVRLAGFAGARLGWSPDAFWQATPAELAAVAVAVAAAAVEAGGGAVATPPDAATIATMREAFPDG